MATVLSKSERNQRIDALLADLVSQRGVTAAAVVDSDGFVTHLRRDFDIDSDALGAASQVVFTAATRAAEQVRQGHPIARGFVLVLVADGSAMLGAVRFELKQTVPELEKLFAG